MFSRMKWIVLLSGVCCGALLGAPASLASQHVDEVTEVTPEPLRAPAVTLSADDLTRDLALRRWRAAVAPAPEAAEMPVLAPDATGTQARQLRSWVAGGTAAGLTGVFYDNRDGGHSRLDPGRFPQMSHIVYDEGLRDQGAHRSLAHNFLFPGPVLGNASLAVTGGASARSLPRLAMTTPDAPMAAAVGYLNNHLYVYPAHHDVRGGVDVLPAMLPYFAISLGSSHSDRPVVELLAMALASLRPETRARAEAEGLLAPTLTMLLRRSLQGVTDYLGPEAHPSAIQRNRLRPGVAMAAAQALRPEDLPPVVLIRVLEESFGEAAGLLGRSERLFDTPAAIARLWRDWSGRQEMVVSAAATQDPNGRALEFHWVVLSGEPGAVRITPLDPAGRRARLEIDWHSTPFTPPSGGPSRNRVEIAVIAWNGVQYSAPSFVTVAFPAHQRRVYGPDASGVPQLLSVDYDAAAREERFDPALWWQAAWRDTAIRDDLGQIIGWRRTEADGASQLITPPDFGSYSLRNPSSATPTLTWSPP